MNDKIIQAAQAVINRWDSPNWEWDKHGGTANLIADLRNAIAEAPAQPPAPTVDQIMLAYRQAKIGWGGDGSFNREADFRARLTKLMQP